jgi:hypothetical protein
MAAAAAVAAAIDRSDYRFVALGRIDG